MSAGAIAIAVIFFLILTGGWVFAVWRATRGEGFH